MLALLDPKSSHVGFYPGEVMRQMLEIPITVLFLSQNDWQQPQCPSVGQRLQAGAAQLPRSC